MKNNQNVTISSVKSKIDKKTSIVFISIFMSILVLPTLLWLILSVANIFNPNIMEKINFDTGENRNMAEFPDEFNVETFPSDIEKWYNDNAPFRSFIYDMNQKMETALEKNYVKNIKPLLTQIFHPIKAEDLNDKYNDGYEAGKNEGFEAGKNEGYEAGKNEGFEDGYKQGYEDGTGGQVGNTCAHIYAPGKIILAPTCTNLGIYERTCTKCGYSSRFDIEANGHTLEHIKTIEMTCVIDHKKIYHCTTCDEVVEEVLEKAHHIGEEIKFVLPSYEDYGYSLQKCKVCRAEYRINVTEKLYNLEYTAPYYMGNNYVLQGRNDWFFFNGEGNMLWYQGNDFISDETFEAWYQILLKFNNYCESNGKKFVILVGPNKEHIYSEYLPTLEIYDEYKELERFVDYVTERSNIKFVYPVKELQDAKKNWQLYYKHDTHWNDAGAYIALQEVYKELGLPQINLFNLPVISYEYTSDKLVGSEHYKDLLPMAGLNQSDYYDIKYEINYEGFASYGYDSLSNKKFVYFGDSYRILPSKYVAKDFPNMILYHYRAFENELEIPGGAEAVKNADYFVVSANERAISLLFINLEKIAKELGL